MSNPNPTLDQRAPTRRIRFAAESAADDIPTTIQPLMSVRPMPSFGSLSSSLERSVHELFQALARLQGDRVVAETMPVAVAALAISFAVVLGAFASALIRHV